MWTKSISNILGMGIFSSCILAAVLPVQAQIMIQGGNGNLSANLNYDYNNPIVPIVNRLTGLDINSFNLETDIGRISNFQGTGQLKEVSNLAGTLQNGQPTIGTLSSLITGGSQITNGNLLRELSNLGITAADQFSLPQLGFNPQVIQTLINNPNYGNIGSPGLTTIPGLPSRIYPSLTAPNR